jgi:oligopeptidase B
MTKKQKHLITAHGHTRNDEYYWLRDDQRKDSDVLAHLKAENKACEAALAHTADLQDTLFEEMTSRLDPDESSVPCQVDDYWYYSRFEAGKEYRIYARRKGNMDAKEEILLDTNERAHGHDYYSLGGFEVSDDHRHIAIAEDFVSRGMHEVRILDLESGEFTTDHIDGAATSLAWSSDGQYLFYLKKHPETLLGYRVMRHTAGTVSETDTLIYEETDKHFYNYLQRSRSREYLFLSHQSTETSEVQLLRADDPLTKFRPFLARQTGHEYEIDHSIVDGEGRFFIRSNHDAVNFRVMTVADKDHGDYSKWQQVTPAREDAMVESIQAFNSWLLVGERKNGLRQVRIMAHDGSVDRYLEAAEEDYVMWPGYNVCTDTSKIRYCYSSLITPSQVLEIDLQTNVIELLKEDRVGGGYDRSQFRTGRLWITARDGTRVPVSMARHRETPLDGTAPALIYAYGSYGHSMDPSFRSSAISLMERGFIYLIAHVRGGEEMGRTWYDNGRKLNKFNTFYDFIDVTHELQKRSLIDSDRTYAMGGSAGGLLMGVVINLAPELYHGVVAAVPFVDVVTTMLDESIPLTTGEFDEWGNPKIKEYYHYMLSYSPYDQVKAQPYPNLLVTTGLHDSQVQYWEPAKWVARLREKRSNDNLLIFHIDMSAGHGGASGRYKRFRETAREYAFLLDLAGS